MRTRLLLTKFLDLFEPQNFEGTKYTNDKFGYFVVNENEYIIEANQKKVYNQCNRNLYLQSFKIFLKFQQ